VAARMTLTITANSIHLPVVCGACDETMFVIGQPNGKPAYRALCRCRLWLVSADALEDVVSTAVMRRFGWSASFALHIYVQRPERVRVGPVPEEVTCVWQ
jgi:hypothetical protein